MTDQQWKRIWELYESASSLSEEDALAQINSLDEDPVVLEEVRMMLEAGRPRE